MPEGVEFMISFEDCCQDLSTKTQMRTGVRGERQMSSECVFISRGSAVIYSWKEGEQGEAVRQCTGRGSLWEQKG